MNCVIKRHDLHPLDRDRTVAMHSLRLNRGDYNAWIKRCAFDQIRWTASSPDRRSMFRASPDPTHDDWARHLYLKNSVELSPTRRKLKEMIGFKTSDDLEGWIPFWYTEGWTLCTIYYIKYMCKYSHTSPCRVGAAWNRVALPRGPECHVASTRTRAKY